MRILSKEEAEEYLKKARKRRFLADLKEPRYSGAAINFFYSDDARDLYADCPERLERIIGLIESEIKMVSLEEAATMLGVSVPFLRDSLYRTHIRPIEKNGLYSLVDIESMRGKLHKRGAKPRPRPQHGSLFGKTDG